jgi:phosphoribosylanthranilate isomerase
MPEKFPNFIDFILLDSGRPNSDVLGGTGQRHDWSISRQICKDVNIPVYLPGGINVNNVEEAIDFVKPYGIDLCSGVKTGSRLDEVKLRMFFQSLKEISIP